MRVFLLLLFAFFAGTGKAFTQLSKANFFIGGGVRFESASEDNEPDDIYNSGNVFVSPAIGYFILDKLAGGVRVDFGAYKSVSYPVETRVRSTVISPFARYYFIPTRTMFNAFLDVGYLHGTSRYSNLAVTDKLRGFQLLIGPAFFLTDRIALEFTVGIRHTKSDSEVAFVKAAKATTISSGLGVQIHLGKKKE